MTRTTTRTAIIFFLFRLYIYWSVLWGFLVLTIPGLAQYMPLLLKGIDACMMVTAVLYASMTYFAISDEAVRRKLQRLFCACLVLPLSSLGVAYVHGANITSAMVYAIALLRPLSLLMAAIAIATSSLKTSYRKRQRLIRRDLYFLSGLQMLVSSLQLLAPSVGRAFLVRLSKRQSSYLVFSHAHTPGTFPNSIDFAYFLFAAYAVIYYDMTLHSKRPPILMTLIFFFFIAVSGSLTATICFGLLASFLYFRAAGKASLATAFLLSATTVPLLALNSSTVAQAIRLKVANMMLSRLGLLFISAPDLLTKYPWLALFGASGDFHFLLRLIRRLGSVPLIFTYRHSANTINDVFWVAVVLAVGIPLAAFYVWTFFDALMHFIAPRRERTISYKFSRWLCLLLIVSGFLNQILLLRAFSIALIVGLIPVSTIILGRDSADQTLYSSVSAAM